MLRVIISSGVIHCLVCVLPQDETIVVIQRYASNIVNTVTTVNTVNSNNLIELFLHINTII